jgi:predicted HTH transcriptional regulator
MKAESDSEATQSLNRISKEDIESLVSAKVSESHTLDYQQQLPDNDTEKKREFLYDVSSFANAAGGDMVFGIIDERDGSGKGYKRGSTGSLSRARTPKTHSWTRRSGS